jgi:hypothetical protein
MTELYQILGQITYSYSRIDFLISHIAYDFGLTANPYLFFAKTKFEKKINELKDGVTKQLDDAELINEFAAWTEQLHDLREKRNNILHSIILSDNENNETLMFYNYRRDNENLIRDINKYTMDDLKKLNQSYVDIHNDGYMLWHRLKDHSVKLGAAGSL